VNVPLNQIVKQVLAVNLVCGSLFAQDMPRVEKKDGRFALVVEGKPFLMLGAQINNSSSWAAELPHVWPALEDSRQYGRGSGVLGGDGTRAGKVRMKLAERIETKRLAGRSALQ
jgi:hypothetical protein